VVAALVAAAGVSAPRLLFTRANEKFDAHPALYTMRLDGSHVRLFARDAANGAVSLNGSRIAFVRDGAIWTMGRDASQSRRVTQPPKGTKDDDPAWSPDGRTIYFSRYVGASITGPLFAVRADGADERKLTDPKPNTGLAGEGTCDEGPSVSPDGRTIAYTEVGSCRHGTDTSIVTATVAGKAVNARLRFPDNAFTEPLYADAAWAPKGRELAYTVLDFSGNRFSGVYLSRPGRPPLRLVGTTGSDTLEGPAWSPDARSIVVGASPDFWIVDVSKRTYRVVLDRALLMTSKVDSNPAWLP
jgi:Tol biopolymer transport system component